MGFKFDRKLEKNLEREVNKLIEKGIRRILRGNRTLDGGSGRPAAGDVTDPDATSGEGNDSGDSPPPDEGTPPSK